MQIPVRQNKVKNPQFPRAKKIDLFCRFIKFIL
jgi:hypothetical protein